MDWMTDVGEFWLNRLAWLAGLAVVFALLARLMPCNRDMYWWKDLRAARTDLLYWLLVPLFLHVCRLLLFAVGILVLLRGKDPSSLPTREWPPWLQFVLILLFQDVLLYWAHRAFHGRLGWRFHAVHHSPKVLDWLSTQRFHPVNDLFAFVLADVAVLLMGFSPAVVAVLAPFNVIYSAMVHANLNWTFGPLRYVLASPVFHRWHHTTQDEGLNTNFAPTFPILDLLFGTFYMPPDKLPEHFGNGEPDFPEGFWGQLIHPVVAGVTSPGRARRRLALTAAALLGVPALAIVGLHIVASRVETPQAGEEESEVAAIPQPIPAQQPASGRPVLAVALSADGRRAASGDEDGNVTLWDAITKTATRTLKGHSRAVRGVALSGDGRRVVSGGQDGTVRVWDADTGTQTQSLTGSPGFVLGVSLSTDGKVVAAASVDGKVKIWDAEMGAEKLALTADAGAVVAVALSADGEHLALATGRFAKVWRIPAFRQTLSLKGHSDLVYSVAMSADGNCVVTGSFDQLAKVWDLRTGEAKLSLVGHAGPVYSVAVSSDGQRIVTGGKDGAVTVWDATAGRAVLTLAAHGDSVTGVAVSADGKRVVSSGWDGAVKFWAVEPR